MNIKKVKSFEELDKEKFTEMVCSGFSRALSPDYFVYANPDYICLVEEANKYLGAIVVEAIPNLQGVSYLDKIVVAADYQGKGIGRMLWQQLNGASEKAIWRARKENPIIDFYKKKSEGILSFPDITEFMFFYYGLNSHELEIALKYAINKKPTVI